MRVCAAERAATRLLSDPAAIPQQVWRRLLAPQRLATGARVLVVGPQPTLLAEWLTSLAFDVVAACDDPAVVSNGRRELADVEFIRLAPGPRSPLPGHSFDAAFLQPLPAQSGNWLSSSARLFTAGVLASLKPQGQLLWWRREPAPDGHRDNCWTNHLGCFPGEVESTEIPDALFSRTTWDWMRHRSPRAGTRLVTLRTPLDLLTADEWRDYARRGWLTDRRACCPFGESPNSVRRAA
jgi:hypothetical protein